MPTNCVWIDCVADTVKENFLCRQFGRYGPVSHSVVDRTKGRALIYFDDMENAVYSVGEMRGRVINGKKIQVRKVTLSLSNIMSKPKNGTILSIFMVYLINIL